MFETLTNLNLIKLLTTTDQLSIKHASGNDRLAADVEEAVQELVEDYGELCQEFSNLSVQQNNLKEDLRVAEKQINDLEQMLSDRNITFVTYSEVLN